LYNFFFDTTKHQVPAATQIVSKQPLHNALLLELHPGIVHKKGLFAQLLLCDDDNDTKNGGKDTVAVGNRSHDCWN
jgi:hypothetical protein